MIEAGYERILVLPIAQEKKINGIIINLKKPYEMGEVVSVGPNIGIPELAVGSTVYLHQNGGIEVDYLDQKLMSVHKGSILAWVPKEAE